MRSEKLERKDKETGTTNLGYKTKENRTKTEYRFGFCSN